MQLNIKPISTFLFFILVAASLKCFSQPETIEKELNNLYGIEKLTALNQLTNYYSTENQRKAYRYAKQATSLADNIFGENNNFLLNEGDQQIQAYYNLGEILYKRGKFVDSKEQLDKVLAFSIQHGTNKHLQQAEKYLKDINSRMASGEIKETFLKKTVGNLGVGKAINKTTTNFSINTLLKIAAANEKNKDFQGAIDHYDKAINRLQNQGNTEKIGELQLKIAVLLDSLGQHLEAQKLLHKAIVDIENTQDSIPEKVAIDSSEIKQDLAGQIPLNHDSMQTEKENLKALSERFLLEEDFERSQEYLQLYQELSLKMEADSIASVISQRKKEDEILLLKQQKEIADLNIQAAEVEREKQVRFRNTIIIIAFIIFIGTITVLYFFLAKRRDHKKLIKAYDQLDKTKTKLEKAELKIVKLLRQQVSGDIAQELLRSNTDKPEQRFVCVMFLDIRDFTPMAEKLSPEELIAFQNDVFGFMIDIVQKHNGNINQLLGDGFMATFGAPVSRGNDCLNAFNASNEIIGELEKRNQKTTNRSTKIGIGLHAGKVVTGNVGNEDRKQFSVTGNPVIIASRVEQLNKKFNSQLVITEDVYNNLNGSVQSSNGFIEEKVKGRKNPIRVLKFN